MLRMTFPAAGRQPTRRPQHAQAMVEFALILPAFVLLVMGALQIAMLCMVWLTLQGLAEDYVRWQSISSSANMPDTSCNLTIASPWPRPRWANGRSTDINYRNCNLPGFIQSANFTAWNLTPACSAGTDCYASGVRTANQMLTLTATYNWSNMLIMPFIKGGGIINPWSAPSTVTVTASGVMQY